LNQQHAGLCVATIGCTKNTWSIQSELQWEVFPNVGLMAQSRRIVSHDKTFQLDADRGCKVTDANGTVLMEQEVTAVVQFSECVKRRSQFKTG
jgi:monomeric isocitrate dehydrogenase